MKVSEALYQQFEDYLSGSMSASEKSQFELELNNNEFNQAFSDFKASQNLLLLQELSLVNTAFEQAKNNRKKRLKRIFIGTAVAASIIGILSIILIPNPSPGEITPVALTEPIEEVEDIPQENLASSPDTPVEDLSTLTLTNATETELITIENGDTKSSNIITSPISIPDITEDKQNKTVILDSSTVISTSKKEVPVLEKTNSDKPFDCSSWTVNISPSNTCYEESEGSISINSNLPYSAKVNRYGDLIDTYTEDPKNLEYGVYYLDIETSDGCKKSFNEVEIRNTLCLKEIYYLDRTFNPTIEILVPEDYSGNYQILDASGIVLKRASTLDNRIIWDGLNSNGERVAEGIYILISTEGDQTSQTKISVR